MTAHHYDGTPAQTGLQHSCLTGVTQGYNLAGIREGVIERVIPTTDVDNRSKTQTEYDIRDIATGIRYQSARYVVLYGNADNGIEITHRAPSRVTRGKLTRSTPAKDTDATRVLYGFIDGSKDRPVILGCFTHTDFSVDSDGEQFFIKFNSTSVHIDKNGSYTLTRNVDKEQTIMRVDESGNVTIQHKRGATIAIDDGGELSVYSASNKNVVIQKGTQGAARLKDPVDANADMVTWMSTVTAALAAMSANIALIAVKDPTKPLAPVVAPTNTPTELAYISKASDITKIG